MKFGCTMEIVNMDTSGTGEFLKKSKSYWVEMFKMTSAAGFRAIELPYNPGNSSGLTRSGMPISNYMAKTRYGSAKSLRQLLNEVGVDEVTGVHISAQDVMNELISSGQAPDRIFKMLEDWAKEAIEYLVEMGGKGLIISPTPDIGTLEKFFGKNKQGWKNDFLDRVAESINMISRLSAKSGVQTCVKNEFWSLVRGEQIDGFLKRLNTNVKYSPDLAHLKIAGVNPVKVVEKYAGKMAYIRFSDTSFVDKEKNYLKIWPEYPVTGAQRVYYNLGEGDIDISVVYNALKASGYRGWIICDSKKTLNVFRALLLMRWYVDHVILKS